MKKKMLKIKCFGLLLLLAVGHTLVGQKLEKIFYNKEWKGCNESKAFFYRIVTVDDNGKPIGKVLDYFITGELQGEAEGALSIDKTDDKNSVLIGKTIGYYKSGKKNFEHVLDFDGKEISNTHWYENGNKKFEVKYKNEKYNGLYTSYYENGQIKFQQEYQEGKPVDKWALECDEFGKCQNVFFDYFKTDEDENGWGPADKEEYKSQIIV